ncbi:Immunoglobulin, partial [Oryctes borbonicus]
PEYYRDSNRFHRVGDGPEYRLEIPDAKLDFIGTYTVYAKNCYGDAKAIISLQIKVRDPNIKSKIMDKKRISTIQTIPRVINDLKDIRCCDGDSVALECKFDASPSANIRWEKAGKLVHLGDDFNAEFDGSVAKLLISQVYPEDEGEYTCIAYNDLGKAYTSACIVVDVPEGKENLLSQHLSRPPGILSGGSTPRSTPRTTPVRSVSPKLRVREIKSEVPKPRLLKATPPKFYAVPHNRVADEGETVRFQAAIAGHPDPWIVWDKDGEVIVPTSRINLKEVDDLRILEIREVTPQDAGLYRITLENDVGRIEATARLEVVAHRAYPIRGIRARSSSPKPAPTYRRCLVGASSRLGGVARLTSGYRGLPISGIKWYRDDTPIIEDNTGKYNIISDNQETTLEIFHVSFEDKTTYKCLTENDDEIVETLFELDVLDDEENPSYEPPTIVEGLPRAKATLEGSQVKLQLKARGTKPFDAIWIKDGCILPDCGDFKQSIDNFGNISLTIDDCFVQDSGNYRCEVYNTYGEASSKCHVTIY